MAAVRQIRVFTGPKIRHIFVPSANSFYYYYYIVFFFGFAAHNGLIMKLMTILPFNGSLGLCLIFRVFSLIASRYNDNVIIIIPSWRNDDGPKS